MSITIGQKLKETRQSLGLSIAEASFQTHIRETYLDALENNRFDALPSAVQGKGFLRNYASFLKLDLVPVERAWYHPEYLLVDNLASEPIEKDPEEEPPAPLPQPINPPPSLVEVSEPQTVIIHAEKDDQDSTDNLAQSAASTHRESHKQFIALGAQLIQQRELLNLSLEDIERFTNIRSHYLSALETGNLDDLPSVVQGRGMLSNYANFLNMDTESILLKFAEGLQTRRNEQYAPQRLNPKNNSQINPPRVSQPGWRRFVTADLIIVSTLIIALFVFILWGAANVTSNQNSLGSATAPSLSDVLLENPIDPNATLGATTTSQPSSETFSAPTQIVDNNFETLTVEPGSSDLPINIYIISRQRTFLRVTRDGNVVFNGRTVPGNAYEFSGKESIEILTGNAAALEIYYNQEQLGTLGELAEVKTLIFTVAEGMVTPTSPSTATPSPTLKASATQQPTNTVTATATTPLSTATVTPFIP